MRITILLTVLITCCGLRAAESEYSRINPEIYIKNPETTWSAIESQEAGLLKARVKDLFERDMLSNEGSRAYDPTVEFSVYWTKSGQNFRLLDIDRDGNPEVLYNGFMNSDDAKEYLEIYSFTSDKPVQKFASPGFLIAYKIQPNTKEIVLYLHEYPCCSAGSHYIHQLRLLGSEVRDVRRFFVAREHDMQGNLFPEKTSDKGKYRKTKAKVDLRWSSEIIEKGAWTNRTQSNHIAFFDAGSVYKVLAKKGRWQYVLLKTKPMPEAGNMVIRPENFSEIPIYGWIRV